MPDAIGPDLIVEAGHVLRGLSPSGAMVAEVRRERKEAAWEYARIGGGGGGGSPPAPQHAY